MKSISLYNHILACWPFQMLISLFLQINILLLICYSKQHIFAGKLHCRKQQGELGCPKPPTVPDLPLAAGLHVLEASFQPELDGIAPSCNKLWSSAEIPQDSKLGLDFDPFLWSLLSVSVQAPSNFPGINCKLFAILLEKKCNFFPVDGITDVNQT